MVVHVAGNFLVVVQIDRCKDEFFFIIFLFQLGRFGMIEQKEGLNVPVDQHFKLHVFERNERFRLITFDYIDQIVSDDGKRTITPCFFFGKKATHIRVHPFDFVRIVI